MNGLVTQAGNGESFQIYGALPAAFPTGRPDDVPRISRDTAAGHYAYARSLGIETNYLLNGTKGARYFAGDSARVGEYFTMDYARAWSRLNYRFRCYGGCQVRQAHYAFVGQAAGKQAFSDPFQVSCMLKRLTDPASLLDLAGFITPEELHSNLGESGMTGFKITGRSCSAAWIERACRHYLSGHSPTNLFELIVFTSPFLREEFGMEVDQLFYLDSRAYGEFIASARDLRADDRQAYVQETAARLFNSGLLKVNDPGSIYEVRKETLSAAVPGKYFTALRDLLVNDQMKKVGIKIAERVIGRYPI